MTENLKTIENLDKTQISTGEFNSSFLIVGKKKLQVAKINYRILCGFDAKIVYLSVEIYLSRNFLHALLRDLNTDRLFVSFEGRLPFRPFRSNKIDISVRQLHFLLY